jgi:NTP pyrophosphatase (non-canonical NTP hydrolase)
MTYHIYHIPGRKIGVTQNLEARVHTQQGYGPDEYEVLATSDDIDAISELELQLQKEYGYKVDRELYKNLKTKSMKINVTEQTTTFPYPISKLKGNLMDNKGFQWETSHGLFVLNAKSIQWIMNHVQTSMYNDNRCYIYNKAFANWFDSPELFEINEYIEEQKEISTTGASLVSHEKEPLKMFEDIRNWARVRGLYEKGDSKTQYVKLQEEAGELAKALLQNDKAEVIDAIGDMVVVLTNLAHLQGTSIEACIKQAYNVISKRTGKMINGTFVKDE